VTGFKGVPASCPAGSVAMIDSIGIGADVARRDELLRQL
jgi:hypothetical protein